MLARHGKLFHASLHPPLLRKSTHLGLASLCRILPSFSCHSDPLCHSIRCHWPCQPAQICGYPDGECISCYILSAALYADGRLPPTLVTPCSMPLSLPLTLVLRSSLNSIARSRHTHTSILTCSTPTTSNNLPPSLYHHLIQLPSVLKSTQRLHSSHLKMPPLNAHPTNRIHKLANLPANMRSVHTIQLFRVAIPRPFTAYKTSPPVSRSRSTFKLGFLASTSLVASAHRDLTQAVMPSLARAQTMLDQAHLQADVRTPAHAMARWTRTVSIALAQSNVDLTDLILNLPQRPLV